MNKYLSILLFFLFYGAIVSCERSDVHNEVIQNKKVYICTRQNAKKYHTSPSCIGLKNCEGDIVELSTSDAMNIGRKPCQICIHEAVVSTRSDGDKMVYVSTSNDSMYHEYLDCYVLNSKHGYKRISFDKADKENLSLCEICEKAAQTLKGKGNPTPNYYNNSNKSENTTDYKVLLTIGLFIISLIMVLLYKYKKKNRNRLKICDFKPELADTRIISLFLQQFAQKEALKYTTHDWELSMKTRKSPFNNYTDFRNQYCEILSSWEPKVSSSCPLLWKLINNFMIDEEGGQEWSKHNIKVGYNKYVKKWMDSHPGEQPLNMPLSEFPNEIRPILIGTNEVAYFNDIVNEFKKCIQFRDGCLYFAIKAIFKEKHLSFDIKKLQLLKSLTFYTDTELINTAEEL